jgi:hypothetical protein
MNPYTFALVLSLATLALMVNLLRTRRMREKYAIWWTLLALAVLVLALNPRILEWAADLIGIGEPTNLLFVASGSVLLAVCIQFSGELSNLEEDRRALCEELAILRLETQHLSDRVADLRTDLPAVPPATADMPTTDLADVNDKRQPRTHDHPKAAPRGVLW